MRLFGLTIGRERQKALSPVGTRASFMGTIYESFAGAWQRNVEIKRDNVLAYAPVFRCMSQIASDIAKLRIMLVALGEDGIWTETTSPAFSPILAKPNGYQTRIQFLEAWVLSKLGTGNLYCLKQRDNRNVVTALHVLDPTRVRPLVSPSGDVFYELKTDHLAGIADEVVIVPAREIIHDRVNCLFHPLVGVSPLFAASLPASQGYDIQQHAVRFFRNGAQPAGVLSAPGEIDPEDAKTMAAQWKTRFSGDNAGAIAVLSDGLKYEAIAQTAQHAQLAEQLKLSAEQVCTAFGVPPYKIGVTAPPAQSNIQALEIGYYQSCLQPIIEAIEVCLDEGLALPAPYGTELEIANLLRMDTATMAKVEAELVGAGIKAPNEARRNFGLSGKKGGDTPYLQQQNYSLAALDERDRASPLVVSSPAPPPLPAKPTDAEMRANEALVLKAFLEPADA